MVDACCLPLFARESSVLRDAARRHRRARAGSGMADYYDPAGRTAIPNRHELNSERKLSIEWRAQEPAV